MSFYIKYMQYYNFQLSILFCRRWYKTNYLWQRISYGGVWKFIKKRNQPTHKVQKMY